jgi:hypothetical protein
MLRQLIVEYRLTLVFANDLIQTMSQHPAA